MQTKHSLPWKSSQMGVHCIPGMSNNVVRQAFGILPIFDSIQFVFDAENTLCTNKLD